MIFLCFLKFNFSSPHQIETAKRGLAEREELLKNGIAHMQSEALALTRR